MIERKTREIYSVGYGEAKEATFIKDESWKNVPTTSSNNIFTISRPRGWSSFWGHCCYCCFCVRIYLDETMLRSTSGWIVSSKSDMLLSIPLLSSENLSEMDVNVQSSLFGEVVLLWVILVSDKVARKAKLCPKCDDAFADVESPNEISVRWSRSRGLITKSPSLVIYSSTKILNKRNQTYLSFN